jgi:hypothetical protein
MKTNKMITRKLMIMIFLLGTIFLQAQSSLYVQATQDVKLATLEDDAGNTPFTLDVSAKAGFTGFEKDIGHLKIGVKFEKALLSGGEYTRWGVEGGFSFTNLPVPFTNIKYTLTPMVGYGHTDRIYNNQTGESGSMWSFEGSLEFTFEVAKNLSLVSLLTYTTRPDLPKKYGSPNWSVGVEYEIPEFWKKAFGDKHSRF